MAWHLCCMISLLRFSRCAQLVFVWCMLLVHTGSCTKHSSRFLSLFLLLTQSTNLTLLSLISHSTVPALIVSFHILKQSHVRSFWLVPQSTPQFSNFSIFLIESTYVFRRLLLSLQLPVRRTRTSERETVCVWCVTLERVQHPRVTHMLPSTSLQLSNVPSYSSGESFLSLSTIYACLLQLWFYIITNNDVYIFW